MSDEARCTWSDLPVWMCDHCTPATPKPLKPPSTTKMRIAHPVALQTSETRAIEIPNATVITDKPATTHDYIQRLCEPTTHDEPYTIQHTNDDGSHTFVTQRHRTSSPALLEQLGSAIEPLHSDGDGMRVFASKTPARMDAIDALMRIEQQADQLLIELKLPRRDTDTLADIVRRVGANTGEDLRSTARSWWILAKTVTGWDAPSFRPHNTCPLCGVSGGLRVRIDALTAVCVECQEGWDESTIQLLGNHIRLENHEELEGDTPDDAASIA